MPLPSFITKFIFEARKKAEEPETLHLTAYITILESYFQNHYDAQEKIITLISENIAEKLYPKIMEKLLEKKEFQKLLTLVRLELTKKITKKPNKK